MKPDLLITSRNDEREAEFLYQILVESEAGRARELFRALRTESDRQARLWEERMRTQGITVPRFQTRMRLRLVAALIRWLGARRLLPVLAAMKVRGLSIYRGISSPTLEEAMTNVSTGADESWHRGGRSGGPLRAAVFGANDGLVSNASLILGVAGAHADPQVVFLAGAVGLLAGGFSMAAGEYVSVRTQREMLEHQIALEKLELETMPEEEVKELTTIYRAKGVDATAARQIAERIVSNPEEGLKTLAREELGLDPDSLASPVAAALASFFSFAGGAFIPLSPYTFVGGPGAVGATLLLTTLALLVIGGSMSLFTGRGLWFSAFRMMLIGLAAGASTYGLGRLFGVMAV